jgi:hypothetical protein
MRGKRDRALAASQRQLAGAFSEDIDVLGIIDDDGPQKAERRVRPISKEGGPYQAGSGRVQFGDIGTLIAKSGSLGRIALCLKRAGGRGKVRSVRIASDVCIAIAVSHEAADITTGGRASAKVVL